MTTSSSESVTAEHRADAFEPHSHAVGEEARDRRLAGAGRAPQDHAGQAPRRDHAPDRAFGPGQMILPNHLAQIGGPQPVRERRILANGFGA